jgi:hypothetical protein
MKHRIHTPIVAAIRPPGAAFGDGTPKEAVPKMACHTQRLSPPTRTKSLDLIPERFQAPTSHLPRPGNKSAIYFGSDRAGIARFCDLDQG